MRVLDKHTLHNSLLHWFKGAVVYTTFNAH